MVKVVWKDVAGDAKREAVPAIEQMCMPMH